MSGTIRTVQLYRGRGGFGITLSGQAPCVISSVVESSPAFAAAVRVGDSVVTVGDVDVRGAKHEEVVQVR